MMWWCPVIAEVKGMIRLNTSNVLVSVTGIEEHHRCFRLGSYFMAAVLAAASYSRGGFSLCLAGSARRVMFPCGITFHMEPGTIHPCWNLTGTGCL